MITARLLGAAGVGKTDRILKILTKALGRPEVGGDPLRLGFTTLTRIGRREASSRAAAEWGVPLDFLEKDGYFRTTHSIVFRALNINPDELLGADKDDQKWFESEFGQCISTTLDEDGIVEFEGDRELQCMMMLWHIARARLEPLERVWNDACAAGADTPGLHELRACVERYEAAKQRDRRLDFDDLLGRFAGIHFSPDGHAAMPPIGDVPDEVVGWCFDEAQDSSALLVAAQKRLLTGKSVEWCWLAGDAYQAVHSWNGADAKHFLNWPVQKSEQLSKSYRCPKPIIQLGEERLRCLKSGYSDRKVEPADHDGVIETAYDVDDGLDGINPATNTLVLTRTNHQVRRVAALLRERDVPFREIRQASQPSQSDVGRAALMKLAAGCRVTSDEAGCVLRLFHDLGQRSGYTTPRAAKEWDKRCGKPETLSLSEFAGFGLTPAAVSAVRDGSWTRIDEKGRGFVTRAKKWGVDIALKPRVQIGTVHSSKGTEGDHVVLCTGLTRKIHEQQYDQSERHDEERRLEYTAVTRTRRKLTIAADLSTKFQMDIEAT